MALNPDQVRRKRIRQFLHEKGAAPPCLGHYLSGDPECDGLQPCVWRAGCKALQQWAPQAGVDLDRLIATTPATSVTTLAYDLVQAYKPAFNKAADRNLRAWGLFLSGVQDVLPLSAVIMADRDSAMVGDLYIQNHQGKRTSHEWWAIRYKTADEAKTDPGLVRYRLRSSIGIRPTIEFKIRLWQVLKNWPQIREACLRWEDRPHVEDRPMSFGAVAFECRPERLADLGRMAAAQLVRGFVKDMGGYSRSQVKIGRSTPKRRDGSGGDKDAE